MIVGDAVKQRYAMGKAPPRAIAFLMLFNN